MCQSQSFNPNHKSGRSRCFTLSETLITQSEGAPRLCSKARDWSHSNSEEGSHSLNLSRSWIKSRLFLSAHTKASAKFPGGPFQSGNQADFMALHILSRNFCLSAKAPGVVPKLKVCAIIQSTSDSAEEPITYELLSNTLNSTLEANDRPLL